MHDYLCLFTGKKSEISVWIPFSVNLLWNFLVQRFFQGLMVDEKLVLIMTFLLLQIIILAWFFPLCLSTSTRVCWKLDAFFICACHVDEMSINLSRGKVHLYRLLDEKMKRNDNLLNEVWHIYSTIFGTPFYSPPSLVHHFIVHYLWSTIILSLN